MLCHSFGKAVDLLLAVCMLVQEVANILFLLLYCTLIYLRKFYYTLLYSIVLYNIIM